MVDIGANIGIYSYAFRSYCREIHAFEPQSACRAVLEAIRAPNIRLHSVALSDTDETMDLRIPEKDGSRIDGLASLRPLNGNVIIEKVSVTTLDSFGFTDIALLKIDVEGHEMRVLKGALETIRRERPVILIEIEQRHITFPIQEYFTFFKNEGYSGGFLLKGIWHPLDRFSYKEHQKPFEEAMNAERYRRIIGSYVCNFIFTPEESR